MTISKDNDHPLIATGDSQELIFIVKFDLRKGRAPGPDTMTHEPIKVAVGNTFYIHLVKLFTFHFALCMLTKREKLPSLATSYQSINLLSTIMKFFEWVIVKCIWKHSKGIDCMF